MEQAHLDFLKNVLSHVESFNVDWQGVMVDNGFTRKDNTMTKFKNTMKKYGIEYSNNKFVINGSSATADSVTPSKTPTLKTPRKRGPDTNHVSSADDEVTSTPQKKRKTKKEKDPKTTKNEGKKAKAENGHDEKSESVPNISRTP